MIKCSRLEEIQSLMAIKKYCINSKDDCCECKFISICDCMTEEPFKWDLKYDAEKGEENEYTRKERNAIEVSK